MPGFQDPRQDFATEHVDADEAVLYKLAVLIEWWRQANHVVVYTGAGEFPTTNLTLTVP